MSRSALYVRLPIAEASKLDRAAFELGAAKQDLVAGLIASYVDPASAAGLEALAELLGREEKKDKPPFGFSRRLTEPEPFAVGRHKFRSSSDDDVLDVAQAASLLQVDEGVVADLASKGELPGRKLGGEWRFARRALLDWLGAGQGS